MVFEVKDGKIAGVTFPSIMVEMLGQGNVEALLRLTGGDSSPEAGVRDVEKARVLRAVFGKSAPPTDDRQLTVIFEPEEAGNRCLKLYFEEGKRPGIYSTLRLIIGKPGEGEVR